MDEAPATEGRRVTGLVLNDQVVAALTAVLPAVAEHTVAAVTIEVPSYADAFSGRMGQRIEGAVQMALGAFLQLAARSLDSDPGPTLSPALEGAYELGRGEARSGRSVDALLSAYRVGARVAWRELSETAVDRDLPPLMIARFAELVFAYIDELSAASVSGHADELASSDRERLRHLDRLGQEILTGAPTEILLASAERADWRPPDTLTAVLLPSAQTRGVVSRFGQSTLQLSGDLPGIDASESVVRAARPRHARAQSIPFTARTPEPPRGGRACPRLDAGAVVVSPRRAGPRTAPGPQTTPTRSTPTPISSNSSSAPTAKPLTISVAKPSRRWISCAPTPPNGSPKHCDRGCCTKANATRWRLTYSSTPKPCATA